jgi:phage tail-like protein
LATTALTEPLRKFKFRVEISSNLFSMARGGFNKVTGIGVTRDSTEYREGAEDVYVHQLPGIAKSKDVTLSRGMMLDEDFWNMWASSFSKNSDYRMEVTVVQQDPVTGADVRGWVIHNAWVKELNISDQDASSNDVAEETVVLANESVEPVSV